MIDNNFGDNIKKLRVREGLTQAEFAEKINVSPQAVSKWERGEAEAQNNIKRKIESIFKISRSSLEDGYVPKEVSYDKNMETIIEYMDDINKKISKLIRQEDLSKQYLESTLADEKIIPYDRKYDFSDFEPSNIENLVDDGYYDFFLQEIWNYFESYQFEKAFKECDELISEGYGEAAFEAIKMSDKYIRLIGPYDEEELEHELECQRNYAKIFIHYLMKKYKFSSDDLLR